MGLAQILVATDFSSVADTALARAIALAQIHGCGVTLVYAQSIVDEQALSDKDGAAARELGELAKELHADEKREMEARIERFRAAGVPIKTVMRGGPPGEVVAQVAAEIKADLVVIGTHGRTGISRFLLGSAAEQIIRRCACNVLVSRGTAPAHAQYTKIAVATDFSPSSDYSLSSALAIAAPTAPVHVVHAWQFPVGWGLGLFAGRTKASQTLREAITRSAQTRGEQLVAAHKGDRHEFHFDLVEGPPASVITSFAERGGFDLIAIGTHGYRPLERFLLGSVAEATVRHAHCSVLIAHPPRL
jgi:nucleotide-binding universal stress UspA family protein